MKKITNIVLSMVLILCMVGSTVAYAGVDKTGKYEKEFAKIAEKYGVEDLKYEANEEFCNTKTLSEFKDFAETVCKMEKDTRNELDELYKTHELYVRDSILQPRYWEGQTKESNIEGISIYAEYNVNSGRLSYISSISLANYRDENNRWVCWYPYSNITTDVASYTSGTSSYRYEDNTASIVITFKNCKLLTVQYGLFTGLTVYARFYAL